MYLFGSIISHSGITSKRKKTCQVLGTCVPINFKTAQKVVTEVENKDVSFEVNEILFRKLLLEKKPITLADMLHITGNVICQIINTGIMLHIMLYACN